MQRQLNDIQSPKTGHTGISINNLSSVMKQTLKHSSSCDLTLLPRR